MDKVKNWNLRAGHPLQTWEWGEFRIRRGNRVSRVEGEHQYQIIWSEIKFTPWRFGYIPMGPMPTFRDLEIIRREAKKNGAVGVRMEPLAGAGTVSPPGLVLGRHLFKPKTYWWELAKTEEELLAAMNPKCRYNIRLAQKHGVVVAEDNTDQGMADYLELMFGKTTKRQRIYAHSRNYHQQLWEVLEKADLARIFVAKYKGKAVAAWIIFEWKDFIYYAYGAFDDQSRQIMAPVLGLWEIAKWGKGRGYKYFDLWGAEEGKGWSRFKEQFGARTVEMAGTFDLPVNSIIYPLFRIAEEIRWKILRMIK